MTQEQRKWPLRGINHPANIYSNEELADQLSQWDIRWKETAIYMDLQAKRMQGVLSPEETSKTLVEAWDQTKQYFLAQVHVLAGYLGLSESTMQTLMDSPLGTPLTVTSGHCLHQLWPSCKLGWLGSRGWGQNMLWQRPARLSPEIRQGGSQGVMSPKWISLHAPIRTHRMVRWQYTPPQRPVWGPRSDTRS